MSWGNSVGILWGMFATKDVASEEAGNDPTHYWQHVPNGW